jgi:hypothetical protein
MLLCRGGGEKHTTTKILKEEEDFFSSFFDLLWQSLIPLPFFPPRLSCVGILPCVFVCPPSRRIAREMSFQNFCVFFFLDFYFGCLYIYFCFKGKKKERRRRDNNLLSVGGNRQTTRQKSGAR